MSQQIWVSHDFEFDADRPGYQNYVPVYEKVLEVVKPNVVYEWGPGENTRMALGAGACVHAVEQDPRYLFPVATSLIQYHLPVSSPHYVQPFTKADLYFVDSRRRADCIERARSSGPPHHVLVLHDAQRKKYWGALGNYDHILVPDGCTAIATYSKGMFLELAVAFGLEIHATTWALKRMEP